jgi:hypothetical protein
MSLNYPMITGYTNNIVRRELDEVNVTEEVKRMLHFLRLKEHFEVVGSVFSEIGDNFTIYTSKLWTVIVPKNPSSVLMPMLCAHTDTVMDIHPTKFSYTDITQSKICNCEYALCGADDRLGCFLVNRMVKSNPNDFIFALFDKEEIGGLGSSDFGRSEVFEEICKQVSCFIGLDRRGDSDLASYGYESEEFLEVITTIPDFREATGSFTDVANLAADSHISCVNLSVGYYNEHTPSECFSPTECLHTLETLRNLPKALWGTQHVCEEKVYNCSKYDNLYHGNIEFCDSCGRYIEKSEGVRDLVSGYLLCKECYTGWFPENPHIYCEICGGGGKVVQDPSGIMLCESCSDRFNPPLQGKGLKTNKVNLYKFLDFIDFITSECMWTTGGARRNPPPSEVRQVMKDVNYITSVSRYDELRGDQYERVLEICDRYEYMEDLFRDGIKKEDMLY